MSKVKHLLLILLSISVFSICFSLDVNAAEQNNIPSVSHHTNRLRHITYDTHDIIHAYSGDKLVFIYTHNVTYNNNINGQDYTQTLEVEHNYDAIPSASNFNANITTYTTPPNTGDFVFVGWTDDPNSTTAINTKTIRSNTNLYAIYKKPITVRCSRGNTVIGSGYEYYTNGVKLVDAQITLSALSDPNWNNVGYRTDTNNQTWEAQYLAGNTYTFTQDTTLNVVWWKDITKTAVFNANGGSAVNGSTATIRVCYNSGNNSFGYYNHSGNWQSNSNITITTGNSSRAEHTFLGWGIDQGSTAQLGANTAYTFAGGDVSETHTFIAVWKVNYKEEAIINQNPNWIDGGAINCYGDFTVPANAAVIKLEWITNSNSFSYTRGYGLTCGVTPSFTGAQVVRGNSYFKGQINGNQVYEGIWYVCTPGRVVVHNNPDCGTYNELARLHIWYKY